MGVVCTEVVCLGALGLWIGSSGLLDIMFHYLFHTFLLVFLFFSIPLFFCPFVVATTIYLYFLLLFVLLLFVCYHFAPFQTSLRFFCAPLSFLSCCVSCTTYLFPLIYQLCLFVVRS